MPFFEAFRLAIQTIRAQKLKSGFSLLGVFIGVASLIAAWSIANGVNRYMTEKFAQTLYGVNTFQLRRRPMFTPNVPDSVWRAWARRPRIRFNGIRKLRFSDAGNQRRRERTRCRRSALQKGTSRKFIRHDRPSSGQVEQTVLPGQFARTHSNIKLGRDYSPVSSHPSRRSIRRRAKVLHRPRQLHAEFLRSVQWKIRIA